MTSGAMYIGEPHNVPAITPSDKNRAKPKSAIFKMISCTRGLFLSGCERRIFCGFKSRWT